MGGDCMGRMSARFVGNKVGMSTESVYGMWKDMGLVIKDKFGDWTLTEAGISIGGRMSNSNNCPVPRATAFALQKKEKVI